MSKLLNLLFVALTVTFTSCVSNTTQTESLADRTEAAEEAIKNGAGLEDFIPKKEVKA